MRESEANESISSLNLRLTLEDNTSHSYGDFKEKF